MEQTIKNKEFFYQAQNYLSSQVVSGIEKLYEAESDSLESQNMSHLVKLKATATFLHLIEDNNLKINSVLDVCCGDGKLTNSLSLIFDHVEGFDACKNAITYAKKISDAESRFFVGDALFPEEVLTKKYDMIIFHQAHILKRPILGEGYSEKYDVFFNDFIKKYLNFLNSDGVLIVSHGINGPEHIKPERLSVGYKPVLFSQKLPALRSLLPESFKGLATLLDKFLSKLFKTKVTSFYIIKRA